MDMKKVNVLFVCMGNICRSPTAQGVFARQVIHEGLQDWIIVDSAGTHGYHLGEEPDARSQEAALRRGVDLSAQRARQVSDVDLVTFDYVLAMDSGNYTDLIHRCDPDNRYRIRRFLEFAEGLTETDVPDPYYGGARGFEQVLDLVEQASQGLLAAIRREHDV